MNILFVNYGDFTTNSLNHVGGFANALCAAGHACVVAVPRGKETLSQVPDPLFISATYDELLERPGYFPDGKPAALIHAWTPREGVRKFVIAYQREIATPARLIVHLEDNEHFLLEAYTGRPFAELQSASPTATDLWLVDGLSHPLRHEAFLRVADGITHIVDRLREFVPPGLPSHLLLPGVDFTLYYPQPPDLAWRNELGLRADERIIVFTGSNTFANEPEMRELYVAVALLNQRGIPTRLVRTGFNSPKFLAGLPDDLKAYVLDLGFIPKANLPRLLALADVLVQPGHPGPFNDFRLPSKLPEFLASGKPVVLPPANVAALMQDGREAVFLQTGTPGEIADVCAGLFADPARCAALGAAGAALARSHFDLEPNSRALAAFYQATVNQPSEVDWAAAREGTLAEGALFARRLLLSLGQSPGQGRNLSPELGLLAALLQQLEETRETAAEVTAGTRVSGAQANRQHIRHLESLLAQQKEHIARVENLWQLTRNHADNLERFADQHRQAREGTEALLASTRQQVAALEQAAGRAQAEIAHSAELLAGARAEIHRLEEAAAAERQAFAAERETARIGQVRVESEVRAREDKIARMQASFSWRLTAPLRAVRRAFFDRPAPTTTSGALLGAVDDPTNWTVIPPALNIRGWSLLKDRRRLQAGRARLGNRAFPVEFGLERPDVTDHHRDHPGAARCGWQARVEVPRRGAHPFRLEVQDESGAWHLAVSRTLKRTVDVMPSQPDAYAAWVAAYDTLTPEEADRIRQKLAGLKKRPLISVLMPTFNPPEKWLVRAIESVRRQLYDRWELCIADDASTEPHVRKVLAHYQRKDPRIKVAYRETNGHISAASNSALSLAHGEFIALLDHDDEIRPHALACVALELDAHPAADLVYSDEDKIDEAGRRHDHYFKPDWNPDLFVAQNYVSHLGVYRTQLVREVGGFRVGYDGAQDWDLALRVVERTAPDRIRHIPKILYHWRAVPGSTAREIGAKGYAVTAAGKAISEHFGRLGIAATITPTPESYWRVRHPLPEPAPRVTLIIPTRNRLGVLRPCIESILARTTYPNFEILIVDNDSDDAETLAYLRTLATENAARIRVLRFPGEFNFSAINNFGVSQTDAPVVGLLNNDLTVIHGDWLDEMVSHAVRPEIGCVGANLRYPDGRIQHAGTILGIGGVAAHQWQGFPPETPGQAFRNRLQQNLSAVTAACLIIRREVYLAAGGLDEKLKIAFNDIDFCLKVRTAGYRNLWTPYAELHHHESASRGAEDTLEKRDRFRREIEYIQGKWGDVLLHDPAYNPNLTLTTNDFALAVPPRPWPPLA